MSTSGFTFLQFAYGRWFNDDLLLPPGRDRYVQLARMASRKSGYHVPMYCFFSLGTLREQLVRRHL